MVHGIVRASGLSLATWLVVGVAHAQPVAPPGTEPAPDLPDGDALDAVPAPPAPDAARPQPPDEAPPKPVPNVPPAPTYPSAHVARPLLLPLNGLEGYGQISAYRTTIGENFGLESDATLTTYALTPGVRAGLNGVEVEASLDIFLARTADDAFEGTPDPDRLQAFFIAARLRRSADTSAGVSLVAYNITTDYSAIEPTLTLGRKVHLSPVSAFIGGLGFGLQQQSVGEGSSVKALLLEWNGRLQAQVAPTVAVEGRVSMRYLEELGESDVGFDRSSIAFRVGAGVVAAISPTFDLFASVDLVDSGELDSKIFTIGAVGRRVP